MPRLRRNPFERLAVDVRMDMDGIDDVIHDTIEQHYDTAVANVEIHSRDVDLFFKHVRGSDPGWGKTIKFLKRKMNSTDSENALRAFNFLEAVLDFEGRRVGPGPLTFGARIALRGFLHEICALIGTSATSHRTSCSDEVKERAIKFMADATGPKLKRWFPGALPQAFVDVQRVYLKAENILGKRKRASVDDDDDDELRDVTYDKLRIRQRRGLYRDLAALWESKDLSDIVFQCSDGEVQAHKVIIAARSPVFKAMFTSGMSESASNTVKIEDVNLETMNLMLKHMYTGCVVPGSVEQLPDLIRVADKYQLEKLQLACFQHLIDDLNDANAGVLVILAHTFNAANVIKAQIQEFVLKRRGELIKQPEFQKVVKESPEAFGSITYGVFT